ncbi:MAG: type IV pili methyl-accepting chemotaxis transducer N-terminal domain-containing protein, partial [Gammaproteobacteria bacterium]
MTSYGKKLRIVYIGALACIALLSVASHLYLGSIEGTLVNDAPVMNMAGRLRTLSQQISSLSQQLYLDLVRSDFERAATSATQLREAVDEWQPSHRALVSRRGTMGLEGTNSFEIAKALALLDLPMGAASAATNALITESADPAALQGPAASVSLAEIIAGTQRYARSMESILDAYEAEATGKVERLQ